MKKMSEFRLYWRYLRLHTLSGLQYKGWFIMILQTAFNTISEPVVTVLLFLRFGSIGDWSVERILLIYSIGVGCFGLGEVFFRGFDSFPWNMVQRGGYDRVLLRPRSTFLQVAASVFHIHRIARVVSAFGAAGWCLWRMGVVIGPLQALFLLYTLAGGILLYAGVFVLTSGIAFFSVKSLDWIYILTNASYEVTRCPVEYMPRPLYVMFTFVMPLLPIAYYPMSVLCGWGEPLWTGLLALPAGLAFFLVSNLMWRFGERHYNSTGS